MEDLIRTLQNSILSCFGPDKVCILIIDKLPVEFFLLIPTLHFRYFYKLPPIDLSILKAFLLNFVFFIFFIMNTQVAS